MRHQIRYHRAIIHIVGGDFDIQEFATVVDDQMQFETVEPIHTGFAACRQVFQHLVRPDVPIVTDRQTGRVNKTDAAGIDRFFNVIGRVAATTCNSSMGLS